MAEYVVTGGCGFIGSNFIRLLLDQNENATVTNLDALTYASRRDNLQDLEEDPRYTFVEGNIANQERVSDLITGDTDVVVNFAAESHVDRSLNDERPFVISNIYGTQVLLQVVRDRNVPRFLHVSTDEVYGSAPEGTAYDEAAELDPSSPYAASKASADLLIEASRKSYGYRAIITRGTNNFGPYQNPEKFIPLFVTNAIENEPLPLYGDGTNVRDWLFVKDHCEALLALIDNGTPGEIYNIGADCERRNIDVARAIVDLLDRPESLIEFVEDRPGHDQRYALDCEKIRSEVGWTPSHSFDSALRHTVQWYEDHDEWWKPLKEADSAEFDRTSYDPFLNFGDTS